MILYDTDAAGPNPFTVRLFAHERQELAFDVEIVSLAMLENRGKRYRETVNPRGEVPALRLDDGRVLTEITAICEYFDEIATGGQTLVGSTADERAFTRSWTRWVDLEIAQGVSNWWRGTEDAENFYRGNRVIFREGKFELRHMAERGLNALDDHLDGRQFICNDDRPMMADVLLFSFLFTMSASGPWMNNPGRKNVAAWFESMEARPSREAAMNAFSGSVKL